MSLVWWQLPISAISQPPCLGHEGHHHVGVLPRCQLALHGMDPYVRYLKLQQRLSVQKVERRNSKRVDVMGWHTVLVKTHPMMDVSASMRDPNDTSCNPHKEPKSPFYPFQIQDHASLSGLMSRESKSRTLGMSNSIGVFCGLLLVIRKTTSRLNGKCCWVCHQGQAAPESSKNRLSLPNSLFQKETDRLHCFIKSNSCHMPGFLHCPITRRPADDSQGTVQSAAYQD